MRPAKIPLCIFFLLTSFPMSQQILGGGGLNLGILGDLGNILGVGSLVPSPSPSPSPTPTNPNGTSDPAAVPTPLPASAVPCGLFNPLTQICCNGRVWPRPFGFNTLCCGSRFYNRIFQMCCADNLVARIGGFLFARCCGTQSYNTNIQFCCGDRPQPKVLDNDCCGGNVYNSVNQICCPIGKPPVLTVRLKSQGCGQI